jgi:hypothetical protein
MAQIQAKHLRDKRKARYEKLKEKDDEESST